jgi:hypothetical protein
MYFQAVSEGTKRLKRLAGSIVLNRKPATV